MIIAGIDAGIENTRVVIMDDDKILGRAVTSTGGIDRPEQAEKAYQAALAQAGVDREQVEMVAATGKGKYDVPFAQVRRTEIVAAAHGIRFLCPDATSVISVGADETLAVALGEKRLIGEYAINQKCAAGLGSFLSSLAERLEMSQEQMGAVGDPEKPVMNEGCVVFAELDALSMLNNGESRESVAAAAVYAAAVRAAAALRDITCPANDKVALIGGMSRNAAFVRGLEKRLGLELAIPGDAEYAGAIGAAVSGTKGLTA